MSSAGATLRNAACLAAFVALGAAGCRHGGAPASAGVTTMIETVRISVTNKTLHPVSDLLFGQFMERPSWQGETGPEAALLPGSNALDPRVVAMLRDMRIPVVRFPGGTDVDYLDWRDMVTDAHGEGTGRPVSRGHRGDSVTNRFGYDEFLRLAEELGWKTILVVNLREGLLGPGQQDGAAQHAAALVAYCAGTEVSVPESLRMWPRLRAANGHPAPYRVDYVQVGNEWFGYLGWRGDEARKRLGEAWVARVADTVESHVEAVRTVLPEAGIITDQVPVEITDELRRRKAKIDACAFHVYYPWAVDALFDADGKPAGVEKATPQQVWDALVHATETDGEGLAAWHYPELQHARRSGFRVAMTEWNMNGSWELPRREELWPDLGGLGMGAAVMLHNIMRAGDTIELATQSMLVGSRWGINGIRVTPGGGVPPRFHPTALVTTLYNLHHGDRRLAVRYGPGAPQWDAAIRFRPVPPCTNAMLVDVLATRDDGALYLHALNTDYARPYRIAVTMEGFGKPAGRATLHRLRFHTNAEREAAGDWASSETEQVALADGTLVVTLPPRSATVAVVPLPHG